MNFICAGFLFVFDAIWPKSSSQLKTMFFYDVTDVIWALFLSIPMQTTKVPVKKVDEKIFLISLGVLPTSSISIFINYYWQVSDIGFINNFIKFVFILKFIFHLLSKWSFTTLSLDVLCFVDFSSWFSPKLKN